MSTTVCPYCAEEIQPGAKKCKHCGEWLGVPPPGRELALAAPVRTRPGGLRPFWALLILALVAAAGWFGAQTFQTHQEQELQNAEADSQTAAAVSVHRKKTDTNAANPTAAPSPSAVAATPVARGMTQGQFLRIEIGMSYEQVVEILGWEGTETGRSAAMGVTTTTYTWQNSDGASVTATFQNGKLNSKTQVGLK